MSTAGCEENEFDVFVNPDFAGQDLESFADAFAGWAPEEEASRRFSQSDCLELLQHIDRDDKCAEIMGLQEFPCSAGGKLHGAERQV